MIQFKRWSIITACLLIAGVGCVFGQKTEEVVDLFDEAYPKAVAGQKGWGFKKTSTVDLNGDGVKEKIFLIANVSLYRGKPVWDDGQTWQVYVQEPNGRRTYVYSRFVQLGDVEVLTTSAESEKGNAILILERTPHAFSVYEVHYRGYESFRAVQLISREIDSVLTPAALMALFTR